MTQELLATHQILSLFEKSKSLADQIFDNLSGVFANLQNDGKILRANNELALHLKVQPEDVLGLNILQLFRENARAQFAGRLKEVTESRTKSVGFELPMITSGGDERDYLWQITSMYKGVYTCVGRDVSDVKQALSKVVHMEKNLEVTKAVQDLMLPAQHEITNGKIELAASYISADITGGDFWWYDLVSENKIWIVVGDLTGHGAGPAMVTAMVSGCVQTLRDAGRAGELKVELPFIMESIDRRLCALRDQPYWMTAIGVEVCLESDKVKWWGAACPPLCLVSPIGEVQYVEGASSPLGFGQGGLRSGEVAFARGWRLALITDGVFEARNPKQAELGMRRVKKIMEKTRSLSAVGARDQLLRDVNAWRAGFPADDDVTLVLFDRK